MRKSLSLLLASTVLAACGGAPVDENSSSSQDSSSSVSSVSSSSSVVSSSSSSSSSSNNTSYTPGDASTGESLFTSMSCAGCHQKNADGTWGSGGVQYKFVVGSPSSNSYLSGSYSNDEQGLAEYINAYMPYGEMNAPKCNLDNQCAQDIAAYLWQFSDSGGTIVSSFCESEDPVYYGERALKVLTSFEYKNSVQNLFTSPVDESLLTVDTDSNTANMPEHSGLVIGFGRMDTYHQNASKIADWAMNNRNAWSFSCTNDQSAQCADAFITKFAYQAFRRPLTNQERETYSAMITGSDSGLRWAFHSVLMSPQFIYRSELGVKVSDAVNDPSFLGGSNNSGTGAEGYEAGPGGNTVNGQSFNNKTTGEAAPDDGTYNIYSAGSITQSFNFSDPALVVINAHGNDFQERWPQMTVSVGGQVIAMEMVEHYELREYRYLVTGINGNQQLQVEFSNMDEGQEPYGTPGNDKNLYVGDVTVAPAVEVSNDNTVEDTDPLLEADGDAYVLTNYEYAAALAYMYTGTGPSIELLDAAGRGDLNNQDSLDSIILELIDSAKGREQVKRFAGIWLRTDGVVDEQRNASEFTQDVKESMAEEVRQLYSYYFYGNEPFSGFYQGDVAMLDKTLSDYYNVPGGGGSHMDFQPVNTTNSNQRGGILTTGAFMVVNSHDDRTSPIHRAVHVRQDMLCHKIPLPTAGDLQQERDAAIARAQQREAEGDLSTWEFYNIQTNYLPGTDDPTTDACETCHREIINPLAVMEDYDNIGKFRTSQKGLGPNGVDNVAIHTTGTLYGVNGVLSSDLNDPNQQIPLTGGSKGLSKVLATIDGVNDCLVDKSFRFSTGVPISSESQVVGEDPLTTEQQEHFVCVAENLRSEMDAAGGSPLMMLKALGESDVIRFRK